MLHKIISLVYWNCLYRRKSRRTKKEERIIVHQLIE